jgi:hypothetical protein
MLSNSVFRPIAKKGILSTWAMHAYIEARDKLVKKENSFLVLATASLDHPPAAFVCTSHTHDDKVFHTIDVCCWPSELDSTMQAIACNKLRSFYMEKQPEIQLDLGVVYTTDKQAWEYLL